VNGKMDIVPLAETIGGPLGVGEETLWEGHPSWRAWGTETIWGWVLAPLLIGIFLLLRVSLRKRSHWWKLTTKRLESETGIVSKKIDTLGSSPPAIPPRRSPPSSACHRSARSTIAS
jgi:hypothetical protein